MKRQNPTGQIYEKQISYGREKRYKFTKRKKKQKNNNKKKTTADASEK